MSDSVQGDAEPIVSCSLQNGILSVYETHVTIERKSRSNYDDKRIDMGDIYDVEFTPGIMTGHLQIKQRGIEPATGGVFTHPVDENTLYFPRLDRACARDARDAILERMGEDR